MGTQLKPSRYGEDWTREEVVLAFDLYCRIPFARTKANNPLVKELAQLLSRSPGSVARKLGNLGSFDPVLRNANISGLSNTSKLDEQVWNEFHADWSGLVMEADRIRMARCGVAEASGRIEECWDEQCELPVGPSERTVLAKQRVHQTFFRAAVLSAYNGTCCVTGIPLQECLRASHIVPWARDERFRADPTNGLCLSATFDRLFDTGLMTIDADFRVMFAPYVLLSEDAAIKKYFSNLQGNRICLPQRFRPAADRLAWHRENVFAS